MHEAKMAELKGASDVTRACDEVEIDSSRRGGWGRVRGNIRRRSKDTWTLQVYGSITADLYTHVASETDRKAAAGLNDLIGNAVSRRR